MYKDFKSKFSVLAEEETSRYKTGGGLLPGDYITIRKDVFNSPKLKDRPSQFFDRIKEIIGSQLPLKVSAIKSMRPETQHGLYGGAEAPTDYWVDVVQCATPALFVNCMTLPIEVLELQMPEGNNFSPEIPDQWKRKDNSKIKPEEVDVKDSELEKQTSGRNKERNLTRKHVNNALGKEAKDGRSQVDKPKKYKESVDDDTLLAEAAIQILSEGYCPKCKSRLYPNDEEPMEAAGVCGDCVAWDKTPDKRFQKKVEEYRKNKATKKK